MAQTLWIARNKNGQLNIFAEEPFIEGEYFASNDERWFAIDDNIYPEVTWENSPQQVELKLKERNG